MHNEIFKTKFFLWIIMISHCIIACNLKTKGSGYAVIIAKVKGLPRKIYLANAYKYKEFIDSAENVNGEFVFHISSGKVHLPMLVSLSYIDSGKIYTLDFTNTVLPKINIGQRYSENAFMLEKGITRIEGVAHVSNSLIQGTNIDIRIDSVFVYGSKETEALFRAQMMDFGFLDNNSSKRSGQYQSYVDIIKEYPNSHYLLQCIWQNKSLYSNSELGNILSYFSAEAQNFDEAEAIKKYINDRPAKNMELENLILSDNLGVRKPIFKDGATLNVVNFWASWCGPCRLEIPELQEMKTKYGGTKIHFASISIDENSKQWLTALTQLKMDWDQFIIDSTQIEAVKSRYDFSAIPVSIIVDGKGKELKRFTGYDNNNKKIIDSFLLHFGQ
ncbi:MAG: TlpA family protein disulfide reductase [Bacteroidetes bacterium]|nr:TlpA family protein disulfide reductase [Bacteroidota bacterium]